MKTESVAYLSLGSNLGDRQNFLEIAQDEIKKSVGTITSVSPIYENPPIGFSADNDFLNICLQITTDLSPNELISALKVIETNMGREIKTGDGYISRCIDIDIILFESVILKDENLIIPHPRFRQRRFVLLPLNDIAPNAIDPETMLTIQQLLDNCADQSNLRIYGRS